MKCCQCTSKLLLCIVGILFWAVSAGLIFVGAIIFKDYRHYENIAASMYALIPAVVMLGLSVYMLIVGILACVGACAENKCILSSFFIAVLPLILGFATVTILGIVYHEDVHDDLHDAIQKGMIDYTNSTTWRNEIDFVQRELKCCGLGNYTDWCATPYGQERLNNGSFCYPDSCCVAENCTAIMPNTTIVYQEGCLTHLENVFTRNIGIIIGFAVFVFSFLLIGMISACALCCRKGDAPQYIGLNNGMKV